MNVYVRVSIFYYCFEKNSMNFGIIAAGEGSRLASEGVMLPKPLVELEGKPLLGRLIDLFLEIGDGSVCVIVNDKMPEVLSYMHRRVAEGDGRVKMTVKTTPSSMHSFYEVCRMLKGEGRFIVTTVDTVFRADAFCEYADSFRSADRSVEGMMAVTRFVDDEKPLYVEADDAGDICAFRDQSMVESERKKLGLTEFVSGGIYGLDDSAIKVLEECMERGVSRMRNYQRALVEAGLRLKAYDMGKIMDVDHADDIVKAQDFVAESE